jgi:hypothetical protein
MFFYALFILHLLSSVVQASIQIKSQIHHIDVGGPGEETLILLKSGHVTRLLSNGDDKKLNDLVNAFKKKEWIKFRINQNHELEDYQSIKIKRSSHQMEKSFNEETYEPTVLANIEIARNYFQQARFKDKESQCYNRAHVWSYEWFIKNSLFTNKTWLFFTIKYIRKFKFDWWFHVSPSIQVIENERTKEKVMDIKYARGPVDLKGWTDIFMKNDAHCPLVKIYSDYANYPETGWCFTMRTSMFYYQPIDIEVRETMNQIKGNWSDPEVKEAYLEAFDEII